MTIKSRLKKLEEKAGVQKAITLEVLVSASWGDNPEAARMVEEAEARGNDPLLILLTESCKRDMKPEIGN